MGMIAQIIPKRVLLTTFFPRHIGGLQTHFDTLVQGLSNAGFEVLSLQHESTQLRPLEKALLALRFGGSRERAVTYLLKRQITTFAVLLHKFVEAQKVELLHCHDAFSAFCLRNLNLPLVLTIHGPLHLEYKMLGWRKNWALEWLRSIERASYHHANKIITVDSGLRDYVIYEFGVKPDKVHIIRNAVDVNEILKISTRKCDIIKTINLPFALVPRRLVPKNGVLVAVKAMQLLKNQPFQLVIAGDGPEKKKIVAFQQKHGLKDNVILLGEIPHEHIISLMKESFAVVIPSIPSEGVVEATSLAALEAMALGKPVIASNIGGLRELIDHGVDGLLFEAGNEKDLADTLLRVFSEKHLRESLGRKAQIKVSQHYTTEVWLAKILAVYKEAYKQTN